MCNINLLSTEHNEHNELLDPIDEEHLFALHYVFVVRINKSLNQFRMMWNDHGIRTERGQTPNQLFTAGILRLRNSAELCNKCN